jgi:hypothetical protein
MTPRGNSYLGQMGPAMGNGGGMSPQVQQMRPQGSANYNNSRGGGESAQSQYQSSGQQQQIRTRELQPYSNSNQVQMSSRYAPPPGFVSG